MDQLVDQFEKNQSGLVVEALAELLQQPVQAGGRIPGLPDDLFDPVHLILRVVQVVLKKVQDGAQFGLGEMTVRFGDFHQDSDEQHHEAAVNFGLRGLVG